MLNVVERVSAFSVVKTPREVLPNILLVDGDLATASQVQRWSKGCAHASLGQATDVVAAARMLAEREWDLVIVDPAMTGGFEFLRQAKALNRWLATMVVTEAHNQNFIQAAVQCRIDGLMFKPIVEGSFLKQTMELAEEARARRRRGQKRVLAIGAHPDDVEIGCGGALAKHSADGDVLHILTLSSGSAGGDVNVRMREALKAAEMLGAEVDFGNLPDGFISPGIETIKLIQAAIQKFRPTDIYTHSFEDTHQDHRAAHVATLTAARSVPNVYCYQAPSSTVEFNPNRFVDISDFIEAKLRTLGCHKSQVDRSASLSDDMIVATARYWGRYAENGMAEPIKIIRQLAGFKTQDHAVGLPVQTASAIAA